MLTDAPGPFQLVDLSDRQTWHRATLQEWIDLRSKLAHKQEMNKLTPERWKAYVKARSSAIKQVYRESGLSRKKKKPPITGPLQKRFIEIMKENFYDKYHLDGGMTPWELEFLKASEWIDELLTEYASDQYAQGLVRRLADWILTVEAEYQIAEKRKELRDQHADSVSAKPSKQMPYGRNPYLPNPLELIRIYRATLITVARMEAALDRFRAQSDSDVEPGRDSTLVRYDTQRVTEFVRWIRGLGYPMYRDALDASTWRGWCGLGSTARAQLTKEFLGHIFNVNPRTISKDLSRSRLLPLYEKHGVADSERDYLSGRSELRAVRVLPPGWFERLEDGLPSLYEPSRGFFPTQRG